jgi:hypothetical protein
MMFSCVNTNVGPRLGCMPSCRNTPAFGNCSCVSVLLILAACCCLVIKKGVTAGLLLADWVTQ